MTRPQRPPASWPDEVQRILQDPAASFWLKGAITSALQRDPTDALLDAAVLTAVLQRRAWEGRIDGTTRAPTEPIVVRPPSHLLEEAWDELGAEDHKELDTWIGSLLTRLTER